MKKIILSIFAFSGLLASAQITDLPLTASQTQIAPGQNVQITTTGSQIGYQYFLRNNTNLNNIVVDGPIIGTGNNLVFNTGSLYSDGDFNVYATNRFALSFSYDNDKINLGNNNRGIDKEITVAAWIKTASSSGIRNIVVDYSGANDAGFILRTDGNGKASIQGRDGTGTFKNSGASTTNVTNNQWHYVVGTANLNTGVWSIYVDGTLENSTTQSVGVTLANVEDLNIGSSYSNTDAYVGEIRDVTFWDVALSTSDISTNMGSCLTGTETNIIGHYPLSEGIGTVINDYSALAINGTASQGIPAAGVWVVNNSVCRNVLTMSQIINITVTSGITDLPVAAILANVNSGGNSDVITTGSQLGLRYYLRDNNNTVVDGPIDGTGNDLTFNTGAITTTTTFNVYAAYDNAMELTHSADAINLTNNNRGIDKEVTIAAWIKGSTQAAQNIVLDYASGSSTGIILRIGNTGKVSIDGRDATGGYKTSGASTTTVTDNQWHYVVGSINITSGNWKIYVDGTLENTGLNSSGTTLANTHTLFIGKNYSTTGSYQGKIKDVSFWNSELTINEIVATMNGCVLASPNTLIGDYPLNEGVGVVMADYSALALQGNLIAYGTNTGWVEGNSTCLDDLQMTQTATVSVGSVGINELNANSISIYPNPVKNQLFIELDNQKVTEITIIDYSGRIVKTINSNVNTVNVSDLQQGIYILKVATENGVLTNRFIKQ